MALWAIGSFSFFSFLVLSFLFLMNFFCYLIKILYFFYFSWWEKSENVKKSSNFEKKKFTKAGKKIYTFFGDKINFFSFLVKKIQIRWIFLYFRISIVKKIRKSINFDQTEKKVQWQKNSKTKELKNSKKIHNPN